MSKTNINILNSLKIKLKEEEITLKMIATTLKKDVSVISRKLNGEIPMTVTELKAILGMTEDGVLKSGKTTIKF